MAKHEVITLSVSDKEAIASTLSDAFRADPAFVRLFRHTAPGRDLHYRRFMRLWVDNAIREEHLLLGVTSNGHLAGVIGVAGVDGGHGASWSIRHDLPAMLMIVPGIDIGVGLSLLRATAPPKLIPKSACELSMLAVAPEFQGMGIAGALVSAVQELVLQNPTVSGIYLYTTSPGALRFYEQSGFSRQATVTRVGVDVHHLYLEFARSMLHHQC